MHEHRQFDGTIDDYVEFNSGQYSHAEHVSYVRSVVGAGNILLRALGEPTERTTNDVLVEAALWALQYFEATDRANAQIHCAPVRYSPITFRLARALREAWPINEDITEEMARVIHHDGAYAEDPGR